MLGAFRTLHTEGSYLGNFFQMHDIVISCYGGSQFDPQPYFLLTLDYCESSGAQIWCFSHQQQYSMMSGSHQSAATHNRRVLTNILSKTMSHEQFLEVGD
jgi:hypothetical protein